MVGIPATHVLTIHVPKSPSFTVGWILTLRKLGDIFQVNGFNIWHLVMTILMCVTWAVLFVLTAIAFWKGKIFFSTPEDILRDREWEMHGTREEIKISKAPDSGRSSAEYTVTEMHCVRADRPSFHSGHRLAHAHGPAESTIYSSQTLTMV